MTACTDWKMDAQARADSAWINLQGWKGRLDGIRSLIQSYKDLCCAGDPPFDNDCCQLISEFQTANDTPTDTAYANARQAVIDFNFALNAVSCSGATWCVEALGAEGDYRAMVRYIADFQAWMDLWVEFLSKLLNEGCQGTDALPIPTDEE